ncbi:hypothetical protein C3L33_22326, partial [Rhododendron williamsianum]
MSDGGEIRARGLSYVNAMLIQWSRERLGSSSLVFRHPDVLAAVHSLGDANLATAVACYPVRRDKNTIVQITQIPPTAGAMGNIISSAIMVPKELIMQRMQAGAKGRSWEVLLRILEKDGVLRMRQTNAELYLKKQIGSVLGIHIRHRFFSQVEMVVVGFYNHWLNEIDYIGEIAKKDYPRYTLPLKIVIVISGQHEDDSDNCEDVVYTGQGFHSNWLNEIDYMGKIAKKDYLCYTLQLAIVIVIPGQYEDDLDNCEDIVYIGQGGND